MHLLAMGCNAMSTTFSVAMQNAFVFSGDDVKDIEINFGMHKNIIDGLEAAGSKLKHVYFNAGGKWYGKPTHAHAPLCTSVITPVPCSLRQVDVLKPRAHHLHTAKTALKVISSS